MSNDLHVDLKKKNQEKNQNWNCSYWQDRRKMVLRGSYFPGLSNVTLEKL